MQGTDIELKNPSMSFFKRTQDCNGVIRNQLQSVTGLFKPKMTHKELCGAASECVRDPSNLIKRRARTETEDNPTIHYGLIASGNQLMKDAVVRDRISAEKDFLCFDMEAAGLMNHFPCLLIRGLCDYSDSHKNEDWEGYAAMIAAMYAKDLVTRVAPKGLEAEKSAEEILSNV
jgi:nucleoside phosphorylase